MRSGRRSSSPSSQLSSLTLEEIRNKRLQRYTNTSNTLSCASSSSLSSSTPEILLSDTSHPQLQKRTVLFHRLSEDEIITKEKEEGEERKHFDEKKEKIQLQITEKETCPIPPTSSLSPRHLLHQTLIRIFHVTLTPSLPLFHLSALAHELRNKSSGLSSEYFLHEGLIDSLLLERIAHFSTKNEAMEYLIQCFERSVLEGERSNLTSDQLLHIQRCIATHFGLVLQDSSFVNDSVSTSSASPAWIHLRDRLLLEFTRASSPSPAPNTITQSAGCCSVVPSTLLTLLAEQYDYSGLENVFHPLITDVFLRLVNMSLVDSPLPWYLLLLKLSRVHRNYCQIIRTHPYWLPKTTNQTTQHMTGKILERQTILGALCSIGTYRHFIVAQQHFADLLTAIQTQTLSVNTLEARHHTLRTRVHTLLNVLFVVCIYLCVCVRAFKSKILIFFFDSCICYKKFSLIFSKQ